jgi:hypothetical protein
MPNPRQPKIKNVCSGSFGKTQAPMRVVLYSVLKEKQVNFGVLRISSPEHNIEGEIGVMQGVFLIGARVLGRQERGYNAVRLLLSLPSGNYEYLDFGDSHQASLDNGIKIRLTDLISLWPSLPAELDQLVHRTSQNRMRMLSKDETQNTEEAAIDQNVLEQIKLWERNTMHLRPVAFWGAAAVFSSIATMIGIFSH